MINLDTIIYYTITHFSRVPQDACVLTYGGQFFWLQDKLFHNLDLTSVTVCFNCVCKEYVPLCSLMLSFYLFSLSFFLCSLSLSGSNINTLQSSQGAFHSFKFKRRRNVIDPDSSHM